MRHYLLDTYEAAPSLKKVRNNIMVTSNNLIEWLQSEVVLDTDNVVPGGKKIPNKNKEVSLIRNEKLLKGIAKRVTNKGELVLQYKDKEEIISSGEIKV